MAPPMWEILVPRRSNEGLEYTVEHHREWDSQVRRISRGLTITKKVLGHWVSDDGETYIEEMIPVRISCTREEIEDIIDMTKVHYSQLKVTAYKVSDEVIIR